MLQPQSDEEIRPIVEGLKQLDPLLDLRWDAKAVRLTPGSYSELGRLVPPTYDGRWTVIRYATPSWRGEDRPYTVICTLTEPSREGGILHLVHGGAYAPVGEWVLELMRSADAANVAQFAALRKKLWAQSDALEAAESQIDESEVREGLERMAFKQNFAGGVGRFHGKGVDVSPGGILLP